MLYVYHHYYAISLSVYGLNMICYERNTVSKLNYCWEKPCVFSSLFFFFYFFFFRQTVGKGKFPVPVTKELHPHRQSFPISLRSIGLYSYCRTSSSNMTVHISFSWAIHRWTQADRSDIRMLVVSRRGIWKVTKILLVKNINFPTLHIRVNSLVPWSKWKKEIRCLWNDNVAKKASHMAYKLICPF